MNIKISNTIFGIMGLFSIIALYYLNTNALIRPNTNKTLSLSPSL